MREGDNEEEGGGQEVKGGHMTHRKKLKSKPSLSSHNDHLINVYKPISNQKAQMRKVSPTNHSLHQLQASHTSKIYTSIIEDQSNGLSQSKTDFMANRNNMVRRRS